MDRGRFRFSLVLACLSAAGQAGDDRQHGRLVRFRSVACGANRF
ncbi:hypothetical protein HRbin36_01448 [bacterium HR36]|nr:hypothetical protein HRbin36_01448 [bacterium HR36]